jgi:exonuclease SbcC
LRGNQQETKEAEIALQTAYEIASLQERQHLERKPQLSESEDEETLREFITETEKRITENNQNIGQLKARLEQNSKNEESARQEKLTLEKSRTIYIKWDRLCRYFGDEKGKTFRNIAQSFVLKELLNGANFYLHKFTERYELACQAGSLTILIYDHYQGDVCRPASTLSGGESFIVSLSLALGLSSLSKNSLSVDTLFIDEGFGTLSNDYLNVVMDTLEKLRQMGGKKVGIISHVEELRERIKTQIQVTRIDNSRSQIQIISTT